MVRPDDSRWYLVRRSGTDACISHASGSSSTPIVDGPAALAQNALLRP
jgi:hypothetical protein